MRLQERIPVYLKLIDWNKYIEAILPKEEIASTVERIKKNLIILESFWLENPNWRISQLLIASNIIPNIPGNWYYKEDSEILESQGVELREILFWGNNLDIDGNRKPTEWKLIKDLDTDHLETLVSGNWGNERYQEVFKNELKLRNI